MFFVDGFQSFEEGGDLPVLATIQSGKRVKGAFPALSAGGKPRAHKHRKTAASGQFRLDPLRY